MRSRVKQLQQRLFKLSMGDALTKTLLTNCRMIPCKMRALSERLLQRVTVEVAMVRTSLNTRLPRPLMLCPVDIKHGEHMTCNNLMTLC